MDPIQTKSLHDIIHQVKQDLMTYFDTKVDLIFGILSGMERSLSTLGDHVSLLEQRVGVNEDDLTDLSTRVNQLEIDNKYLV